MNVATAKANLSFMINEIKGEKTGIKQIRRCEIESLEFAISALEKQIPKKVRSIDTEYSYFVCDNCGAGIYYSDDFESHEYCLSCGQAIDWSEEK